MRDTSTCVMMSSYLSTYTKTVLGSAMKHLILLLLLPEVSSYVVVGNAPRNVTNTQVRLTRAFSSVSLVGGRWRWEGRVEVRGSDGNHGSICDDSLTANDRNVICGSMFHHRENILGWPINWTAYGGDMAPRVLSVALQCSGNEDDVTECPGFDLIWSDKSVCKDGEAGIRCTSGVGVEFTHPLHAPENVGRPEIFLNGSWGTFCSTGFDDNDATMICAFSGYWTSFGKMTPGSNYGNATDPSLIQNLHCDGNEPSVDFCTWDTSTCNSDKDVGIECEERYLNESAIQLTDGGQPWIGRLEVFLANRNMTVSVCGGDLWFSDDDADVLCRSLNYRYGGKLMKPMPVSQSAPGLIQQLHCYGNEKNIGLCAASWATDSYDCPTYPPLVAAVDCSGGVQVKVTHGVLPFEGTVEMFVNGKWYIVDSATVHQNEAKALCASMGFSDTTPHIFPGNKFHGPVHQHISLDCDSDDIPITKCNIDTKPVNHAKHASIHCFDCGNQIYNRETGVLTSDHYPAPVSNDVDCLYHIRSHGFQPKYRFFFDDLHLGDDDVVTLREDPMQAIVATFSGKQGPPEVIFTKDLYIRFKAHSGAKIRFMWEPATVGREQLERAISVQCTGNDMNVSVDLNKLKAAFVDTDPSYLSLSDVGCAGVTNSNTWSVTATHSSCKTQRLIQPDYIVYKNAVTYSVPGTSPGNVTVKWSVDIDCAFGRNSTVQSNFSLIDEGKALLRINMTSRYNASLHVFTDAGLTQEVKSGEQVKLGIDLYADVSFSSLAGVRLRIQSCSLKDNGTEYPLIQNGCPTNSDTNIISQTATETVFHFKAVEFVAGVTSAYLTCDITYCLPEDTNQACNQRCSRPSHGRRDVEHLSMSVETVSRIINVL